MNFPRLTFPLTVDFCSAGYWIGDQGPFKYGTAVTAFFTDSDITEISNDGIPLLRELERQLQTFGGPLNPYVREREADVEMLRWPEKAAVNCSICFAFHPIKDSTMVMAERADQTGRNETRVRCHSGECGVPIHDDKKQFVFTTKLSPLPGAQKESCLPTLLASRTPAAGPIGMSGYDFTEHVPATGRGSLPAAS